MKIQGLRKYGITPRSGTNKKLIEVTKPPTKIIKKVAVTALLNVRPLIFTIRAAIIREKVLKNNIIIENKIQMQMKAIMPKAINAPTIEAIDTPNITKSSGI